MSKEYKVIWIKPENYSPSELFKQLPSPISRQMTEIYNYSLIDEGFYFVDRLVNEQVASLAFGLFVQEALKHAQSITIENL